MESDSQQSGRWLSSIAWFAHCRRNPIAAGDHGVDRYRSLDDELCRPATHLWFHHHGHGLRSGGAACDGRYRLDDDLAIVAKLLAVLWRHPAAAMFGVGLHL